MVLRYFVGFALPLAVVLTACSDGDSNQKLSEPTPVSLTALIESKPSDVKLEEVVDTYVLGSSNTDVQRERLTEMLKGATVSWSLTVFEVDKESGRYRLTSDLMEGSGKNSIGKFGVVADIYPSQPGDGAAIEKLMTGQRVMVKGIVQSINLRTVLVLSPAVLSH